MDNILEVSGLTKNYENFSLKDVSFYLPEGCITGFVGINGAGKTTTLRTILGLTGKVSGNIKFFDTDIEGNEGKIKDRIGIVLDDGCFYDELTLSEMKSVIAPAYKNWYEQDFIDYLKRFSLNPKQKINTLSKGMRMKFALALALSHKAELLVMDEPTSGLDPLVRSQLLDILKDYMCNGGKGVFFSTHITSDLDKIADMLIMIDDGQIVFQEEKDQLLDSYRIIKGSTEKLNENTRRMFLNIEESTFGFTGITKQSADIMEHMQDVLTERPTIEDIMLANVERRKKMLFSLIKKDFLIVKKYVGIMLIVSFLIPPFMLWRTPEATGAIGFILAAVFSIFMLTQYISLKEHQYPKATTLLCATPYPRRLIVISKYCFCLITYAACCLVFGIDTLIFPKLGAFNMQITVIIFFAIVVLLSLYFPALYKLGYEKTKFIFVIIIMASPVLSAFLFKSGNGIQLVFLDTVSTTAIIIFCIIVSLVVFAISAILSIEFFKKRDLT